MRVSRQPPAAARTQVHSFKVASVAEETTAGVGKALEAIDLAKEQLGEHFSRRRGFAFAAIFASILLIALYLKLRMIERGSPTEN